MIVAKALDLDTRKEMKARIALAGVVHEHGRPMMATTFADARARVGVA